MKFFITTLRLGIPFGLVMGAYFSFTGGWRVGAPLGLFTGLLFGVSLAIFSAFQRRRVLGALPEFGDETLIHEGPANHFLRGEGVGGWLYLTPERLLFRSHRFNFQPHETSLSLAEIVSAAPAMTAGIIPNGLLVSTAAGAKERFVVEGRRRWTEAIAAAKSRLS